MPAMARPLPPLPGLAALLDAVRMLHRAERAGDDTVRSGVPNPRVIPPAPPAGSPREQPPAQPDQGPDVVWALVARAQQGEKEAFGELYDRYIDAVFRYVRFRVRDVALAEDLTSETFVRALNRINSVSWRGCDFRAWLVTIARNVVIDHVKSARFRLEVSTPDLLDGGRTVDGPEGAVLDAAVSETLVDAIRRLTPDQQECVVLRFLQDMSVAETAQIMSKSEGAVKVLQFRAVRSLAKLLPAGLLT